jgi:4-amino-4-deoxy-L-arabinose transferase-like glycosyltransferase
MLTTEVLLFLWFLILLFNASLLWVWYRLRIKPRRRLEQDTVQPPKISVSPAEEEPAREAVSVAKPASKPPAFTSHLDVTLDIPEGTLIRLTVESISLWGDGASPQVIEITRQGDRLISKEVVQAHPLAPGMEIAQPAKIPAEPASVDTTVSPVDRISQAPSIQVPANTPAAGEANFLESSRARLVDFLGQLKDWWKTRAPRELLTAFERTPSLAGRSLPTIPYEQVLPIAGWKDRLLLAIGGFGLLGATLIAWQAIGWDLKAPLMMTLVLGVGIAWLAGYTLTRHQLPQRFGLLVWRFGAWLGVDAYRLLCLLLGVLFSAVAGYAAGIDSLMKSPIVAVVSWVVGLGFVLLGAWRKEEGLRLPRWVWVTVVVIFSLALVLRAYDTAHVPVALTGDEGNIAINAIEFIKGNTDNIFVTGWHAFPTLYYYFQSIFISWMGNTIEALRLPAAVAGALTVVATYLFGRSMFGERAGLLAGILLAGLHFHIHFSRIGLNNIWDGLWYTLTLGLIWTGWQKERRLAYVLAGLSLGFSQYFYASARLLFILIPAWLLLSGLSDLPRLKRALPNILLMLLVACVCVLPLSVYFSAHPNDIFGPMKGVSIFGTWMDTEEKLTGLPALYILLRQIVLGFAAFAFTPLKYWYHPGTPILRWGPAIFFVVGLILLFLRQRGPRALLLVGWLITFGLIGGFSESTPAAQRYVAVAPACVLLVGYGLDETGTWLAKRWPLRAWIASALVFSLVVVMAADDVRFYFREYTPNSYLNGKYDFAGYGSATAQYLADYLQDKTSQWEVYFFGANRLGYYSISSLPYLAPHIHGVDMNFPWGSPQNPTVSGNRMIFVFIPGSEAELAAVRQDYPGGKYLEQKYRDGSLLYYLYEYPATDN